MVKLLLVDDEAAFIETLSERLQLRDFDVSTAQSGEQAISVMVDKKPDVVLMDLSLPDMDGLSAMEKIHGIDEKTKVIILSGHGMSQRKKCLDQGAFNYITKPVKLVELIELINNAYTNQSTN